MSQQIERLCFVMTPLLALCGGIIIYIQRVLNNKSGKPASRPNVTLWSKWHDIISVSVLSVVLNGLLNVTACYVGKLRNTHLGVIFSRL